MNNLNYFLERDKKTGEMLYLEYDKIDGYRVNPKAKVENAIRVNKIVFVNPTLSEKLIRKKIEIKIRYLLKKLEEFNSGEGTSGDIQNTIIEAEKLRVMVINNYIKYLGNTYQSLTLKKIQVIINELRIKLFENINNKKRIVNNDLFYLDDDEYQEEEKKGRGR